MVNMDSPKSMGKKVAMVKQVKGNQMWVELLEPVHNADGLCYFDGRELAGCEGEHGRGKSSDL